MWAGVLFFLFCVGFVFYVFEHINIWIRRNEEQKPKKDNSNIDLVEAIKIEMAETPFLSSKFIFKKVSKNMIEHFAFVQSILNGNHFLLRCRGESNEVRIFFTTLAIAFSILTQCCWWFRCRNCRKNGPFEF